MKDYKRIKVILGKLEIVWGLHPDMRLGQLIMNLNTMSEWGEGDIWNCTDFDWNGMLNNVIFKASKT